MKLIQIKPLETHKQSYKKRSKRDDEVRANPSRSEVALPKRRGKTNWFLEGDESLRHKSNKNQ